MLVGHGLHLVVHRLHDRDLLSEVVAAELLALNRRRDLLAQVLEGLHDVRLHGAGQGEHNGEIARGAGASPGVAREADVVHFDFERRASVAVLGAQKRREHLHGYAESDSSIKCSMFSVPVS